MQLYLFEIEECDCDTYLTNNIKTSFCIKELDYNTAMRLVVKNHYLHRQAPCSRSYGIYCNKCEKIAGLIIYGVSCSSTLLKGICGEEEKSNIYELTRLWIKDGTPKNMESFLIGNTLKMLDKEIIVSFADSDHGHVGTVYQASNFIYCGLSAKFKDPKIKGLEHQHHATYANGMNMQEIRDKYGADNVYYVDRSRKHRYIFFNSNKKRKKDLLSKLRYPILPYPKKLENNEAEND